MITVDCWRSDTPNQMSALREQTAADGWTVGDAVTQAASTLWTFPGILAANYHSDVLRVDGPVTVENVHVDDDVSLLPERLADEGYETGAFAASNPNLDVWQEYFDTWRNSDLERFPDASSVVYELDYYSHLLAQRPRVAATEVAQLARKWFESRSGPRFCWLHLMELHSPYYPGLRKALDVGLLDAYRANRRLTRGSKRSLLDSPDADRVVDVLEALYYKTVERLDEQLSTVLSFVPDDAIVVLVGDHGEEFNHGWLEHTRLYDECVTVPLYARNLDVDANPVRHIDIAPAILSELGLSVPDDWAGTAKSDATETSFLVEPSTGELESVFTGIRTADRKVIERRPLDNPARVESVEYYNLDTDPEERNSLSEPDAAARDARDELHQFLDDITYGLDQYNTSGNVGVDGNVERRLEELGYR
nr:sulfatase-like hydrolase/transferase [Halovenus carboxidivorans]